MSACVARVRLSRQERSLRAERGGERATSVARGWDEKGAAMREFSPKAKGERREPGLRARAVRRETRGRIPSPPVVATTLQPSGRLPAPLRLSRVAPPPHKVFTTLRGPRVFVRSGEGSEPRVWLADGMRKARARWPNLPIAVLRHSTVSIDVRTRVLPMQALHHVQPCSMHSEGALFR